jgi:hypothetical protein
MKVRLSADRTALEFNAPYNRVIARYGAQKRPTIRIPPQRLLSEALLRRMVRKNSGATPGLAEMAETGGNSLGRLCLRGRRPFCCLSQGLRFRRQWA